MGETWLYYAPIVVFPPSYLSGGKTDYGGGRGGGKGNGPLTTTLNYKTWTV